MGEGHGLAANYWDVFIDLCSNQCNTTANESIWEAEFAGDYTSEVRAEGRIGNLIGIKCPDESNDQSLIDAKDPGFGYAYFWSTPKLYELYKDNGDINRMNWNIAPFEYVEAVSKKGVTGRQFEYGKLEEVKTNIGMCLTAMAKVILPRKREITRKPKPTQKRTTHVLAENTAENMRHTAPKRTRTTLHSTSHCYAIRTYY